MVVPVKPIFYREIVPWLERCQERAYDEPALRESVDQYILLVRKLTGTDLEGTYMTALKKLILENKNLVLVHDLSEAMFEARVSLLKSFWEEIDATVQARIPNLPKKSSESVSEEDIREFLRRQRGEHYHGLYYSFGIGASLATEVERFMYFGVCCSKQDHKREHRQLRDILRNLGGNDGPEDWWPWIQWDSRKFNYKNPERNHLRLLADTEARQQYAEEVADGLSRVWDAVRDYAVDSAQGS